MIYAQINTGGVCDAVTEASGVVDAPNAIEIGAYMTELCGCTWDGSSFKRNGVIVYTPNIGGPQQDQSP